MSKSTRLIPRTTPRSDDRQVVEAVNLTFAQAKGSSRSTYLGGVRNQAGVVYREVALDDFDQLLALSNRLQKIGFEEEIVEPTELVEGYDLTFAKH